MIEQYPFGSTGHQSTRVIFGAAALSVMKQNKADAILDLLFEYGVNHIDTCAYQNSCVRRTVAGIVIDFPLRSHTHTLLETRAHGSCCAKLGKIAVCRCRKADQTSMMAAGMQEEVPPEIDGEKRSLQPSGASQNRQCYRLELLPIIAP
jgi:hypothetical protein